MPYLSIPTYCTFNIPISVQYVVLFAAHIKNPFKYL